MPLSRAPVRRLLQRLTLLLPLALLAMGTHRSFAQERARRPPPQRGSEGARAPNPPRAVQGNLLITNVQLLDGTGTPVHSASVRIVGDRIAAVGNLTQQPREWVYNGGGKVLAPGFIDTHSHADDGIFDHPDALAAVSQGITTIVGGQDGGSPPSLEEYFRKVESAGSAINVAMYAGHGSIRAAVLGNNFRRVASDSEVTRMEQILQKEMESGAIGLSSGLEYDPGIYSAPSEVLRLAKVAASYQGRYISHIRSEDRRFWLAIDEIIQIGREAKLPVQVSHMKLAMHSLWGHADSLIRVLDRARAEGIEISADVYPYPYWQSTLTVMFPDRNFEDRAAATFAVTEVSTPSGLLIGRFDPDTAYVGKTVMEISQLRGKDPVTTLMDLIRESQALEQKTGHGTESVIATSMSEPDIEKLLAWPHTNICTDGELDGRHPRGYGSFPRVFSRYVRERKLFRMAQAVHQMTQLAAQHMGIENRGVIRPGMFADLVLIDRNVVGDRATPTNPHALSDGIERVWVNGIVVYAGQKATGAKPGQVIRHAAAPRAR